MQRKNVVDAMARRQEGGSSEISDKVSKSLEDLALKWVKENPDKVVPLDEVDLIIAQMPPYLEVLASDAFMNEARERYKEEGLRLDYDIAVLLAILYMTWRLPNRGKACPASADPNPFLDYEIRAKEAIREDRVHELIEESDTSPLAFQALQEVVGMTRRRIESMPEGLREWIFDVAEGKRVMPARGQGRNPFSNQVRNELIVRTIQALTDCGLTATRNEASEHRSACDAVSDALKVHGIELTYDGVVKVWAKGKDNPTAYNAIPE